MCTFVSLHHIKYMYLQMCVCVCIYDCNINVHIYIYMTSILEEILPCLSPRFYEVSMDAICGCNRTFLYLLDRVSHGTMGTTSKRDKN